MLTERIRTLFRAWLSRDAGEAGMDELLQELQTLPEPDLQELLREAYDNFEPRQPVFTADQSEALLANIRETICNTTPLPVHRPWWRYAAAAAILLLLATGAYKFLTHRPPDAPPLASQQERFHNDVAPGHNGAVLHLSNGQTITLDSAANGTVARQGRVEAVKENGTLKYKGQTAEIIYNTITTDRGRQWQLTMSDGTKVWLNAASSIHYPLTFTGPIREVEITGEAYFEVAHNDKQPFRVKAGSQTIEDIGTAFNVNGYPDEPAPKTTLVEGAVSVNGILLQPGQQAAIINDRVKVSAANTEEALAWKNGLFSFDRADIHTVMRQLSRWYNVEVKFEGTPDNIPFQGEIGRSLTLVQVLHVLEQVHVHFRIEEDKRIVILP